MDTIAPTVIGGRFSVRRIAATGGMGRVCDAIDLSTGERIALKLMQERSAPLELERFTREAETLAALRHPGIVRYIAHGQTETGEGYLAMEWLDGDDLRHRLEQRGLSVTETVLLARQVADALAAAHEAGVIHRDLKPSNLFLLGGEVSCVKIIDFGIARHAAQVHALTRTGVQVGTPMYMAPEQARGERAIKPAVDMFSLGCILYECLAGHPPFVADHLAALLARILFEEARPLDVEAPHVPEGLARLIARMLAKDPLGRPRDAAALRDELGALSPGTLVHDLAPAGSAPAPAQTITAREQYLVSVVVARPYEGTDALLPTLDPTSLPEATGRREALEPLLLQFGVHVESLADGTLVATSSLAQTGNAADLALQIARCAILIHERWPEAVVALATGRAQVDAFGHVPVGEAIDRAVRLARRSSPTMNLGGPRSSRVEQPIDGVLIDEASAHLLRPRFLTTTTRDAIVLQGERLGSDDTRLLLGKPTPCVGRELELALLDLNLQRCIDESKAHALVVVAPPGVGKSRLRHEFLRRGEGREIQILIGRGDPTTAGSPYGLLAHALRHLCEIQLGDAPDAARDKLRARVSAHLAPADADRVTEFLGELCGLAFPDEGRPQLRAARADPKVMSDQVGRAFVDLLRAECEAHPVLLILEDLHWSDGLTVKLVEAGLRELELPLLVLALARPEALEMFPNLWSKHRDVLTLSEISAKACERLVRGALGKGAPDELVSRLVKQSAGNALFLEELIRAASEGKGERLPETVLAVLQTRLSRLDAATRRLLRAGAVFGATFWREGAAELCGLEPDGPKVDACLALAVGEELIERVKESRLPSGVQYVFRHALMRDAAYGLLTEQDRRVGHGLAARYLERIGEPDPGVLADHYREGGDLASAAPFYLRAADQAVAGHDLATALQRVEHGLGCGPVGELLGALRGLQCYSHFWNDQWETAYPFGAEALTLLPAGSYRWCKTMGTMLTITSLSGKLEQFGKLVESFATVEVAAAARTAYVEAAALLTAMFAYLGRREQAKLFVDRIERIGALQSADDAMTPGWVHFAQVYFSSLLGSDPWHTLELSRRGRDAFEKAGSTRNYVMLSNFTGILQAELGDPEEGAAIMRRVLVVAQQLNEALALSRTGVCLAFILCFHGPLAACDEASALANQTVKTPGINSIYLGMAHDVLGHVHFRNGRLANAEREARRALEVLKSIPTLRLGASSTLIRTLLATGRADDAKAVADAGLAESERVGDIGFAEVRLRVAAAEARDAAGDADGARAVLRSALDHIALRAGRITDPDWRARYLERAPENLRARELAARLGVTSP
jgi:eukaryotic-like serine/threonine-protein kinase